MKRTITDSKLQEEELLYSYGIEDMTENERKLHKRIQELKGLNAGNLEFIAYQDQRIANLCKAISDNKQHYTEAMDAVKGIYNVTIENAKSLMDKKVSEYEHRIFDLELECGQLRQDKTVLKAQVELGKCREVAKKVDRTRTSCHCCKKKKVLKTLLYVQEVGVI